MSMNLSIWVLLLLVFRVGFAAAEEKHNPRDYISWDDLKVDVDEISSARFNAVEEQRNGSRVIVVDQNGSGDSLTVQGAVDMVPEYNSRRIKIFILPGTYREKVKVPTSKRYISFIGDRNRAWETVITWHDKAADRAADGSELGTSRSATVSVKSDYFAASGITIENTIDARRGGYKMQAVALRISGEKAMFYNVRFLGTQDTLFDHEGSHYFYKCHIQGSVDFIFGNARSLYKDCVIRSVAKRKRWGAIAAHHRDSADENTGFSFVNCKITGTGRVLLGRAWGDYSRAIYSFCDIDNMIAPSGWGDWNIPSRQKTAVFGEHMCTGKGARRKHRVKWSKYLEYTEAKPFLDLGFIEGEKWLRL